MAFITVSTKFNKILFSGFRGVALTEKTRNDGPNDGRVINIIPTATRCEGYNNYRGTEFQYMYNQ